MGITIKNCQFCGADHGVRCPSVKAIEYFEDGKIKRVEFTTAADYPSAMSPVTTTWPQQPFTSAISNTWGSRNG